ncbi:carboxypeptidase regulatory-like domain-containing protein [Thermococcus argininiproducens]|uniref:Carboxypeptidase regulatory-like domain-containing protein n=1 Tax=Thermococcus argininiproducens TaxID=2866384 RepID=A0A9E7MAM3_9EURY|nr:NEW3 domain-containing protein [Thermococcus argininiproducens]USG99944.1 carboxypeptidase regulatory-like domain-containing protein [Thermococcus argininiproducens]
MKKLTFVLTLFLLASISPVTASLPWITVFEGRLQVGERLIVGNYQITITQEKYTLDSYAIIYKEEKIRSVVELNGTLEIDNIRIISGSFNENGIFIVLQYKPSFLERIEPQERAVFDIDGYSVLIVNSSEEMVSLKINGADLTIKNNSSRVYDKLILVYNNGILDIYSANVQVRHKKEENYEIYYPFTSLNIDAGNKVQLPITIVNGGTDSLELSLRILSKPADWEVGFFDENSNYRINGLILTPGGSVTVNLLINIPETARGMYTTAFAIGEKIGRINLNVTEAPSGGIGLKLPLLSIEAEAGEKIIFPIQFTSYTDEKVVELQIRGLSPEWDAYFSLNGQRVRSFLLDGSEVVNLVVKSPKNAELGEHKITFSVNGIEKNVSVLIYKTHKGEPAKLILTIVDEEGKPVSKAKVQIGNETYIANANGILERALPKGNYTIVVSKEGYETKEEKISLEDGEEKGKTITLTRLSYYFVVEMESNHLTTGFDFQPVYEIRIDNLGKEDDEYALSIEGLPSDWAVNFLRDMQSNLEIKSIKVGSEESKSTYLRIIPSFNAKPGIYNATLKIKSTSGNEIEKQFEVEVMGRYELHLEASNYLVSLQPAEEKIIPITLRNFGNTVTNVNIEVDAPQGWDVEVEPQKLAKIEEKAVEAINLRIRPSKTTPAGEYRINIEVKSDQTESQIQLTARVRQSSSSVYLGIIILVVAFVAVILMMRRVGRG